MTAEDWDWGVGLAARGARGTPSDISSSVALFVLAMTEWAGYRVKEREDAKYNREA
jgi:hypothetical protein